MLVAFPPPTTPRGAIVTIARVVHALHEIAPPTLAEPWDNVGLLLGDPAAPCDHALVALEAGPKLLARAARLGAQLIVTHHPPIFRPLTRLTADAPGAALLLDAAKHGIALATAHTNYDVAPGGVSDVLAGLLDLRHTQPLARAERSGQAKIVVFAPAGDLDAVRAALDASGAGVLGRYDGCTFRTPGTGTFRPLEGASPTLGEVGARQEVDELRLEALVPLALAGQAVAAVRQAHSYEEPAIDVYPLEGGRLGLGLGRCGRLPKPTRAARLVYRIKQLLRTPRVRVVGDLRRRIERVAVCGGSGEKLIDDAIRTGCQLYLTGDVTHHRALAAADAGLVVVDAGHAATEAPAIPPLADRLRRLCPAVTFTPVPPSPTGPFRFR